jgi:predicted transcriptional regulator
MKAGSVRKGSIAEYVLDILIKEGELPSSEIVELSENPNVRSVQTALSRMVASGLIAKNSNQKPHMFYITQAGEQEYVMLNPDADVELNDWTLYQDTKEPEQEQENEEKAKKQCAQKKAPKQDTKDGKQGSFTVTQKDGKLKFTFTFEVEIEGIQ